MSRSKILVVDDDPTHLACARELLEADGHEVVIHETAFGATEKVKSERPDLLLLDVNMPALSGEALVAILREREATRETPVVLYSSNDEASLQRAAGRLGVAGWVAKGDPAELRRTVARVLARTERPELAAAASAGDVVPRTLRIVGSVPLEAWSRLGARVLPKLRTASDARIRLDLSATLGPDGSELAAEIRLVLAELGLADVLRVEP
jgi:CheY-like chemotaxis protein